MLLSWTLVPHTNFCWRALQTKCDKCCAYKTPWMRNKGFGKHIRIDVNDNQIEFVYPTLDTFCRKLPEGFLLFIQWISQHSIVDKSLRQYLGCSAVSGPFTLAITKLDDLQMMPLISRQFPLLMTVFMIYACTYTLMYECRAKNKPD